MGKLEELQKNIITDEDIKDYKNILFHDLECLELKKTHDNKYHYELLYGNLKYFIKIMKKDRDTLILSIQLLEKQRR